MPEPIIAEPGIREFLSSLFGLADLDIADKLLRVAIVLFIVLFAKVFLFVVRRVSRWMVYAGWGPFRYIFRDHQRSITIHALLISLAHYVVYGIALGYILGELGVDYTTYLASLSLVGIAIGFGSQGLVQDVVTGFFILFEGQFFVGDMVAISGQVGVVEAIGLRTTRVRDYLGAVVVLQNRSIAMVMRYPSGAMHAVVDVAITRDSADRAADLLQRTTNELAKQFGGVVTGAVRVQGLVELATGECFARLQTGIWPAQQWVIDTQLVPRIREIFEREGIEIPAARIVAFYHEQGDEIGLPGQPPPTLSAGWMTDDAD
ncbi:MAG: mechanosensitive ion channel family protein [bacterium]|nr:mechanosensitive ion channel family protein [bacterium]